MSTILIENKRIYSSEKSIIDADVKNDELLILMEGSGENSVELNGVHLLHVSKESNLICFTKDGFCIVAANKLSFYTKVGEMVSVVHVGKHIHQLFPFNKGVLCIYGDEGVFGNDVGQQIVNFAEPNKPLQSLENFALQYDFSFDLLIAKAKPLAIIDLKENAIRFFNAQLEEEKILSVPFLVGHIQSFAITFDTAIFVEDEQIIIWPYLKGSDYLQYPVKTTTALQTINFRHTGHFIEVKSNEIIQYTILS